MGQNWFVNTLFWGGTFARDYGPQPDHAHGPFHAITMMGAIGAMCRSPYIDGLQQYGADGVNVHRWAIVPEDPPADWASGVQEKGFTEQDIVNFIVRQLDAQNVLVPPSEYADDEHPMYVVILPQGLFSRNYFNSAVGLHWTFEYRGRRAPCAWVMQGNSLNGTTPIVGHEIVEVIGSQTGVGELADDCEDMTALLDGVMVQGYKSRVDNWQCVIPGLVTDRPPWALPTAHVNG
jgi:hypothetical protein